MRFYEKIIITTIVLTHTAKHDNRVNDNSNDNNERLYEVTIVLVHYKDEKHRKETRCVWIEREVKIK